MCGEFNVSLICENIFILGCLIWLMLMCGYLLGLSVGWLVMWFRFIVMC